MTPIQYYWAVIGFVSLLLLLLAMRELWFALRTPSLHQERGMFWFNAIFLLTSSILLLWGGYYLDGARREFENIFVAYPDSRYAIEENSIIHNGVWVYRTNSKREDVVRFFRDYALANGMNVLEDGDMRMSFSTPTGNLFLTIVEENGTLRLYFSREGTVDVVTMPK